MSDVFISYSKRSPEPTHSLAAILDERGIDIWWDTDLLAGARFQAALLEKIQAAKAVIVIWTPESATSQWVFWEASIASATKRLIPVRAGGLRDIGLIPEPFRELHTIPIEAVSEVIKALKSLGIETQITIDDMISALAPRNPLYSERIRAFLEECKSGSFRVETRKTIMLKKRVGRRNINFATIYPESGSVDTSYLSYFADQAGRPEISENYVRAVATLVDGEVLTDGTKRAMRVFVNGAPPKLDRLLSDGGARWLSSLKEAAQAFETA